MQVTDSPMKSAASPPQNVDLDIEDMKDIGDLDEDKQGMNPKSDSDYLSEKYDQPSEVIEPEKQEPEKPKEPQKIVKKY